jgi:RimJ/RimL family protein N-acetyltransferase
MAPEARRTKVPDAAPILVTQRLVLRRFTVADAPFILVLLNDPAWLEFIGDKGVRTQEDARNYLLHGPIAMYEREGFGLFLVERKRDRLPVGMCGLIRRPSLADVDIGFALLPDHRGQGYAHEAAAAVMAYGHATLGIERIVAITSPANARSAALLEKMGMTLEKTVMLDGHEHEVRLYASRS